MCLENVDSKLAKKMRKQEKTIVAYKIVKKGSFRYYPLHINTGTPFKKGKNVSIAKRVKYEGNRYYISGFHSFLDLEEAKSHLEQFPHQNRILIKVFIDPKDVLTVGESGFFPARQTVVSKTIRIRDYKDCSKQEIKYAQTV
jgi:hypothetical protein